MFYNSTRKHSYLGYVSPNEYEKVHWCFTECPFSLTTTQGFIMLRGYPMIFSF